MIVMNLELNNLYAFKDFKINFSYPKKIVNSSIEGEYLPSKPNFRYKKVNILMGGNASGKTSLGRAMVDIFNFLVREKTDLLEEAVCNKNDNASFSIDFVEEGTLYRAECMIRAGEKETTKKFELEVYEASIAKKDSYESCVKKLNKKIADEESTFFEKLEALPKFGWHFALTDDFPGGFFVKDKHSDPEILRIVLQALDTDILSVEEIEEVENSFVIRKENHSVIIQDGKTITDSKLSSGTRSGITIARMIGSIRQSFAGCYYCDEKFSFIHSELEKAILSIMISSLKNENQLFFTTHNMEILNMDLPVHSFTFLKKNPVIEAVYPEDYIKKNDLSLYNAVKNDVFNCTPNLEKLFELEDILYEED